MRRRPFHESLSQQAAQKRTIHLHHVWKIQIEHVADRSLHQRVISTDIENAIAAQEIEIRLITHVVEIRALGTRIDFVETDDALRCHQRTVYVPLVQFVILAKTRGDNLLRIESHEDESFSDSCSKRKWQGRRAAPSGHHSADVLTKKSCRIQNESCSSILRIQFRLIFDYHTLDCAALRRSCVINANLLASSQWSCHSLARRVNDVRSCAKGETYRALVAPDDDRLARLVGCHRARLVSCVCGCLCRSCWSCRRSSFFRRSRAGLCKRQWRNQSADQSNDCSFHSMPPS